MLWAWIRETCLIRQESRLLAITKEFDSYYMTLFWNAAVSHLERQSFFLFQDLKHMEQETTFSVQSFWYSRVLPFKKLPQEVKEEEDFILFAETRFLWAGKIC